MWLGKCHPGYTANSDNAATYRNKVVDVDRDGIAVTTCTSGLGCHGLGKTWDSLVVHEPIP